MPENISVPKLLQDGVALQLNSKMINSNKSFVFLGEPNKLINKTPSTYVEAFDQYITGLYILYHDYGMYFLRSYTNEAKSLLKCYGYNDHVQFIFNSRSLLQHSDDYETQKYVYKKLKKYYFNNDPTFLFKDWRDFWSNANEKHWEKLVGIIVRDSDRFYARYMDKIASHDARLKNVYESIAKIFETGKYTIEYKSTVVKMYEKSLDYRFLKIIYNKLCNLGGWSDETKAKQELSDFYQQKDFSNKEDEVHENGKLTPQEIKSRAITVFISFLTNGECVDSNCLFQYLCQTIHELIENQIKADMDSETEDLLE